MKRNISLLLSLMVSIPAFSAEKEAKGLLPELKINSSDENANQKKALQSEILITKTENQAIQSLISIIKRSKGKSTEPDLWYRLAELYMRRAKSGRFFDLNKDGDGPIRFAPPEVREESAVASLKRAIQVYTKIEREFPNFREMDAVLFNNAFASQQIGLKKNAEALYYKVVTLHPKSPLVPDAYLSLGEISYEAQKFADALESFLKIEKFPQSRVYSYGMYKSAWSHYNLKHNDEAINKLIQVVKYHDPDKQDAKKVNHNLRSESLRDLAIFFEETQKAENAYVFFAKISTPDETAENLITLGKIYDSHARQKEMNIFLLDLIKKQPLARQRVKAEMLMVTGNETARNRPEALKSLISASQTCARGSDWRKANADVAEAECDYDFAKVNIEMAKKWWELWQKNKASKDAVSIGEYTQEAFKIHLDREDPTKPDTKSRYAYAELLYQMGEYRAASMNYEKAATSVDTTIAHDSAYAALVSLEKANEKKKMPTDDAEVVRLSKAYLAKYPTGTHSTNVKFKIGFIAYENNDFIEAEKWLRPLAADDKAKEFKGKSEDLMLDILNARKDYAGIKGFSKQMLGQTKDTGRKTKLTKIMQEADYTEIQEFAKTSDKVQAAQKLMAFHKENPNSPLAKDSLWQAMSLYYADGQVIEGAELALDYAKRYPEDKRSLDALKDAAKYFAEAGYVLPAAQTMELVAEKSPEEKDKYIEAASELYFVEGKKKEAQITLKKQLTDKNTAKHGKIYAKLLATMKGEENSSEYKNIEAKIVSLGHEPYASEIKVARVEKTLKDGKLTEAFNAAKPLVASDNGIDDDVRARARLVQAKVLEAEFIAQSTKTTLEKLSVVLGIKTEKLDKAQTAFLTAAKIAKDPDTKLEALQGLNRIYTNYVETVGHPIVKDKLSDEDNKALLEELAKLTSPILEKKVDTDKKLQQLAKEFKAAGSNEVDYANLPVETTVKPRVKPISVDQLRVYLPVIAASTGAVTRYEGSKSDSCKWAETDKALTVAALSDKANKCVSAKNPGMTERYGMLMTRKEPKSPMGVFYMGLSAEMMNQEEKALWLVELAIKKSGDAPYLLYQRARMLAKTGQNAESNADFIKASDLGLKSPELTLMHGVVSFAQGDCFTAIDDFTQLDRKMISQFDLAPAISECQAQKGEFDKAIAFAEQSIPGYAKPVDLWLQIGHVHETYRFDSTKAIVAYESALKTAPGSEQKSWIQRKLSYLKNQRSVSSYEGGTEQ